MAMAAPLLALAAKWALRSDRGILGRRSVCWHYGMIKRVASRMAAAPGREGESR